MRQTNKLLIILAVAAVLLFLPLAAGATTTYVLNLENTGAAFVNPPPFGEVTVDLTSSTTATIQFTTLAPPPPSGGADDYTFTQKIGASVNGTFSVSNITGNGPFSWITNPNNGEQTFDGFGTFGLVITVPNQGSGADADVITFTLTNTGGTWSSDANVLALNSNNYHVAAHEYSDLFPSIGGVGNTFYVVDSAVPLPPSVLLLGSGLLGMGLMGIRRKIS